MPLRFRRTIKIAPGVKLNLSKGGVSTTVGTKNLHFNFGKRGVKRTVSIPGTGLSEVDYIKKNETEDEKEKEEKREEAKERREERREVKRTERKATSGAAAIPNTGHAAAREQIAAGGSTGLRNFFLLLAIVVFFFAGAAVLGLLPAHFFSNALQNFAQLMRSTGH